MGSIARATPLLYFYPRGNRSTGGNSAPFFCETAAKLRDKGCVARRNLEMMVAPKTRRAVASSIVRDVIDVEAENRALVSAILLSPGDFGLGLGINPRFLHVL